MDILRQTLQKARRRLFVALWARFTVRGLAWAIGTACLWVLLVRLFPVLGAPGAVVVGIVAIGLAGALTLACMKRPTDLTAALETDRRAALGERLTSSYELAGAQGEFFEALHVDARHHLKHVDVVRLFPLRPQKGIKPLALVCAAFAMAYVIPELDILGYREQEEAKRKLVEARRVTAARIEDAANPLRELTRENEIGRLSSLVGDLDRIAEGVEEGSLTDKQALARLTKVGQELQEHQNELGQTFASPKTMAETSKAEKASAIGKAIEQGDFSKAAEEMRALEQQLNEALEKAANGEDVGAELEALAEEMAQLAEMMGGDKSELGQAMGKAAEMLQKARTGGACPSPANAAALAKQLAQMQAVQGMTGALSEMAMLSEAMDSLAVAGDNLLGEPGRFGRMAFSGNKPGDGAGVGSLPGTGPGMRGPGHGQGGAIGDLPDSEFALDPTMLPGEMTQGKLLASIMQRAAPEEGAESTIEIVNQAITQVRQQTEQALTKEEIPPGSRELVREYFRTLEPEQAAE